MNPDYPVYVISKGRWEKRLTVDALTERGIPFKLVIEPQEYDNYSAFVPHDLILVLPFSNLGQGSIPARNWVWEHAIGSGAERHWILDDNIRDFYRLTNNIKYRTDDGTTFRVIEDFVNRYENIALAGMQYESLTPRISKLRPLIINTRVYSCILIKNDIPYRWRGRYNEDTDLSLRVLKGGLCTVLFRAFLADKIATMSMKGGNTEDLYKLSDGKDGRLLMAQSLRAQHPDVVRVIRRWNRWQHLVDYRPFSGNKLILREGVNIPQGVNNYGMSLVDLRQIEAVK